MFLILPGQTVEQGLVVLVVHSGLKSLDGTIGLESDQGVLDFRHCVESRRVNDRAGTRSLLRKKGLWKQGYGFRFAQTDGKLLERSI